MSARAPGKIILSGEHAVVYGRPALVTAVQRYAWGRAEPRNDGKLAVECPGMGHYSHSVSRLDNLLEQARGRLREHRAGMRPAHRVLDRPMDLFALTAAMLCEVRDLRCSAGGATLHLQSEIPMGCGMGASAAMILVTLDALATLAGHPLAAQRIDPLALQVEHFQHGKSSGVDPTTCRRGGVLLFRKGYASPLDVEIPDAWLVDTGKPLVSTGQCVENVRKQFGEHPIWNQFATTTQYLEDALRNHRQTDWLEGLRKNHELLRQIGVVPQPVDDFIHQVERLGGAGKICGAGATSGTRGGMVLVSGVSDPADLAHRFGYSSYPLEIDRNGLRHLPDEVRG